jgi:hypothetical protein
MAMEDSRAVWRFGWLESVMQDVRYALRGFGKSPGFALAVVGTIGAALGLNTTVFTVFNAYVLRPIAVHDPWALYGFTWYGKNGQGHRFTWGQYQDAAARKSPFSEVMAVEGLQADVEGRTLFGQVVSGSYFTILGIGAAEGRESGGSHDLLAKILAYALAVQSSPAAAQDASAERKGQKSKARRLRNRAADRDLTVNQSADRDFIAGSIRETGTGSVKNKRSCSRSRIGSNIEQDVSQPNSGTSGQCRSNSGKRDVRRID